MIGKADWTKYLHEIRKREVELVFSLLPERHFATGLEVGAGDGYQTTLLAPHIDKLVSSDLNFKRIKDDLKVPNVEYKTLDADAIGGKFSPDSFDFIFSSNVLEHVRDPQKFLESTLPMLTSDGVAVHIIPSRHIKISYLLLFYPHMVRLVFDRIIGKFKGKPVFRGEKVNHENNINTDATSASKSRFKKFVLPSIHGNFRSHTEEFNAYGKKEWEKLFKIAGYSIVAQAKGPAFSGYGFGLGAIRKMVEKCGGSSEHIFILKKQSAFETRARSYTDVYLSNANFDEKEKFIEDWVNKERNGKAFVKDFVRAVGNPQGKKVLDIGFGNGIILTEFEKAGVIGYGVETENRLLNLAEVRLKENNLHATLVIYDGKKFPFPDNIFDYAYSTSVLEHMSYPEDVLKEITRTLTPGGKFYLSFPNKYAPKETHTGLWFISWLPRSLTSYILKWTHRSPLEDWNLHFISFFTLKRMAKNAGLQIVYDTESQNSVRGLIKKSLAKLGIHYGVLLRTIILVLEKPDTK